MAQVKYDALYFEQAMTIFITVKGGVIIRNFVPDSGFGTYAKLTDMVLIYFKTELCKEFLASVGGASVGKICV